MFLWPIFDFFKANRWAQIALICVATILTLGIYLAMRDNGVRQRDRAVQEVERARERARMLETMNQIKQETRDAKDRALDAPRHVDDVGSADELRERYPANAEVILRPRPAGGSNGPR